MVEMLVGLNVTDEARYAEYRRRITPLLESGGGSFGYDFRVSEVLPYNPAHLMALRVRVQVRDLCGFKTTVGGQLFKKSPWVSETFEAPTPFRFNRKV